MADLEKTVAIVFKGKDDLSKTVKSISGSMDDFGKVTMGIAEPLASMATNVLKLNAALVALAGTGLVYAFNKSKDFESATIELQKVIGDEADKLGVAQTNALALSDTYGVAASEILDSTANFKQAGFNIEGAMLLVKSSMDLAIAGQLDAAESSEYLVSILKGFKAPATEAARVTDVLNEISNKYATNVQELAIGMAKVSPIAKLMGLSFEETAAFLVPTIEVFRSGDEAGTALRTSFLKLLDDAKPVQDGLRSLGVAQKDANGAMRQGKDIIFDIAQAFGSANENEKLFLAQQLVGIRQAGKFVQSFDDIDRTMKIVSDGMGSAGSAAAEVAARLESSQVSVDRFKVGFQNLAIVVGDQFRASAKEAIDGGTKIENALQSLVDDGTFKPIFDTLSGVADDLGSFLSDIATALPDAFGQVEFDKFLESLGALGGEIGTFFGNLDLTKPDDLAKAIQFVIDSVTSLIDVTTGMVEVWQPVITAIGKAIDAFNNLDVSTKEIVGNVLALSQVVVGIAVPLSLAGHAAVFLAKGFTLAVAPVKLLASGVAAISSGPVALGALALGAGAVAGTLINKFVPGVEATAQGLLGLIDVEGDYFGALGKTREELERGDAAFEAARGRYAKLAAAVMEASSPLVVSIDSDPDIEKRMAEIRAQVAAGIPDEKETKVVTVVDEPKLKEAEEKVAAVLSKEMEIEAKVDIAKFEAVYEAMQSNFEWQAKLDIAEVEANAEIINTLGETIGKTFAVSGETISELYGLIGETTGGWDKAGLLGSIAEQEKMQREQLELEKQLTISQIDLTKKKTERIDKGDAIIKIDGSGLAPELEAFMFAVLDGVQIRATEEYSEFLLGTD